MATLHASAEAHISAPAAQVYRYIADFRQHHPQFLPAAFSNVQVQLGGYGAGTVVTFDLTVGRHTRTVHSEVAEPAPGRMLTETDMQTGAVTTFTVTPVGDGCRVRIEAAWRPARGLAGLVERLAGPMVAGSLLADELRLLAWYSRERAADTPVRVVARRA